MITDKDIILLLSKLDNRKIIGPDEIRGKILKHLSSNECLINVIYKLPDKCFKFEKIPNIWKTAIVIRQYKWGSIYLKCIYRPISLKSVWGKAFEKLIKKIMYEVLKGMINITSNIVSAMLNQIFWLKF